MTAGVRRTATPRVGSCLSPNASRTVGMPASAVCWRRVPTPCADCAPAACRLCTLVRLTALPSLLLHHLHNVHHHFLLFILPQSSACSFLGRSRPAPMCPMLTMLVGAGGAVLQRDQTTGRLPARAGVQARPLPQRRARNMPRADRLIRVRTRAAQFHPDRVRFDFVWLSARTMHPPWGVRVVSLT